MITLIMMKVIVTVKNNKGNNDVISNNMVINVTLMKDRL